MADVGLVTPLRDGMNLVAKEFVAAQNGDDPGVLVLSRFAGAAEELDGALLVNPYDTAETAAAIGRAARMPRSERVARWRSMFDHLVEHDAARWRETFLQELEPSRRLLRRVV
jgi:trehalose 6-phosphate synthase